MSEEQNNNSKAKVSVITDADCELILDDEIIATIQAGKTKQVFVERGEHFFTARSSDYKDIRQEIAKNIDDVSFKYLIKIELADKVQRLKDEKAKRLKDEENNRRQEAERREREKREAELRKAERKAWWKRNRSEFLIALAVIALSVTGSLIYLNWDYSLKTLKGHSDDVESVCWSPDGKYLASGSQDGTIKIWDANTGQHLKTWEGYSGIVESVSWSPDGKYLASGSWDKTVIIWDAKSGKTLKTFESDSFNCFRSVAWSPNGKYLAGGSKIPDVIIWKLK